MKPTELAVLRCEIEALMAEFAYLVDQGEGERVADLFIEQGVYTIEGGGSSCGRENIRIAYAKRGAQGQRNARHIFTNLRLLIEEPDIVRATSILLLFAEDGEPPHDSTPLLVADYRDRLVRQQDGRWLFVERLASAPAFARKRTKPRLPLGSAL